MVVAAILDERADADWLTRAELVAATADRGITSRPSTAQALLRELRSPRRLCPPAGPAPEPRAAGRNGGRASPRPR